ncbi:MAG TPA: thiol reductant ABC exporter subunit CydD [Candidatus Binatia bacterium]|nr:thiol reductant ABC exporter subunit CydD [Candidatus Binatia bacterium]
MTLSAPGPSRGPLESRLLARPAVRRSIAASVGLGLVSSASVVVQALALAGLLAWAMGSGPGGPVPALLWVAGAAVVRGACGLAGEVVAVRGAEATKAVLRAELVQGALRASGGAGGAATLAGRGLDALDAYVGRCLPDLLLAAVVPLALLAVVGTLDWLSGITLLVAALLFPLFGMLVGQSSGSRAARRWGQIEAFGVQIADLFEGLPVLRAFGRSTEQRQRVAEAGEALRRAGLSTLRVALLSALVLDTLASVAVALVAVPLGLRLVGGSVSLASALAVLIVAPEVVLPLRRASAEFHESTEGLAAAGRVLDLVGSAGPPLLSSLAVRARPPAAPDPARAAVELRGVRVELGAPGAAVLDEAWLRIEPGETVALTGRNGAGKSTTLLLLLGLLRPVGGTVSVGGVDLAALDVEAWRRRLAYLPERPTLLSATLADNLRLGDPTAEDGHLLEVLASVGGAGLLRRLPQGLLTPVGEGGRPLSAGERQLIALARTLLRPASLLLLDEPSAHLDRAAEAAAIDTLRRCLGGRSALVVSHRPAVLGLADRVVTLEAGSFQAAARESSAQSSGTMVARL